MQNGNYEQLVEQITDLVLSRLDGADYCPTFCRADVERIVDAGAERIGIVLGSTATAHDWASLIDHTLLKPEASEADIKKLCDEAAQFGFASVCVNPSWVKRASEFLRGTSVPVCTVIGFPLGATLPDVKAFEARRAIFNGASEVDMVINIGALKSGDDCTVEDDIRAVVDAAHENGVLCKVIIETALLTDEEKVRACLSSKNAGADFVKTSTGFAKGGATVDDVALKPQAASKASKTPAPCSKPEPPASAPPSASKSRRKRAASSQISSPEAIKKLSSVVILWCSNRDWERGQECPRSG
jgi:deoxyribose-phosphate aldolase